MSCLRARCLISLADRLTFFFSSAISVRSTSFPSTTLASEKNEKIAFVRDGSRKNFAELSSRSSISQSCASDWEMLSPHIVFQRERLISLFAKIMNLNRDSPERHTQSCKYALTSDTSLSSLRRG